MRRRILNTGITVLPVTLSSYSYSATPASGTKTVTAYYGGVAITDLTTSMITKGGNMTSVSVSSSGVITMSYSSNTSTYSTKSSTMTLTYQGQSVTFTITQTQDYVTSTTEKSKTTITGELDSESRPEGRIMTYNVYRSNCSSRGTVGYWIRVYNLKQTTTTCYYDRSYYASGNFVDGSCKRTETTTKRISDDYMNPTNVSFSQTLTVGNTYNLGTVAIKGTSPNINFNITSASFKINSQEEYTSPSGYCTSKTWYKYNVDMTFTYNGTVYTATSKPMTPDFY